ncbi:MAG: TRAP transporter substrate-binding protein [Pseudomonadota bacterium]
MTIHPRFMLALVAGLSLAMGAGTASAETWRMATKQPTDSPEGKVFQYFADKVDEYSDGQLEIKIFPNEQLGKTDAVMEQIQQGTVQLYAEGSTYMRKWVPQISWVSAAFLFDDRDHWVRFVNSDLVKGWYAKAAEEAKVGILGEPTAMLRGPYRVMVTNKDVGSYDDIKGIKLRMHPDKLAHALWTHLGADVKTLAWTDVYQAIDKEIVEAVNSPIALVESMRFHEVAPHVVRHDEYYQSIAFMMNQDAFEALSPELQEALLKAHADAGKFSEEVMTAAADESIERMKAGGVTFTDVDRAPFVESMESFYKELKASGELPDGFLELVEETRPQS